MQVNGLDVSCLKDRRIVLDPGHGGIFPGARGRGGLKEADVNLGVALYLWGLLRDAGAQVFLTRSSDKDFTKEPGGSLRDDLSERIELAASFQPDLFVSLHHNADISRSKHKNQIETYFRMLDEGPSRDVALLIHKHLTDHLGIEKGEVVPGNYFVLRNAPCPAVLGEPSYLTNPWVEEKLRLAEKQRLEAQAYFLGILEYFSRGSPKVISLWPCDTVITEAWPTLSAAVSVQSSGIDTSSVIWKIDGTTLAADCNLEHGTLAARVERPLVSGTHELCLSFRNLKGNSSGELCCSFETLLPEASFRITACPDSLPIEGAVLIATILTDANGNAVRDSTEVLFASQHGSFSQDLTGTVAGTASSIFFPDPSIPKAIIRVSTQVIRDSIALETSVLRTHVVRATCARTGESLGGVEILEEDSLICETTPQGFAVLVGNDRGRIILRKEGFVPAFVSRKEKIPSQASGEVQMLRMEPAAVGVLAEKRITIDIGTVPGASEKEAKCARTQLDGGSGPDAEAEFGGILSNDSRRHVFTSTSQRLQAQVAICLARILKRAGAEVLVLGEMIPATEKVRKSELFRAQRYLRVELAPEGSPSLLHYPGSSAGIKAASALSRWWKTILSDGEPRIKEDAHYVLLQTSCPALIARLPSSAGKLQTWSAEALAYALYLGIAEDLGLEPQMLSRFTVRSQGLPPSEVVRIILDESISLPTSGHGSVTFFCEEGTHLVKIVTERGRSVQQFVSIPKGRGIKLELNMK